jgi:DNA-binding MarR family transcriptional regulator
MKIKKGTDMTPRQVRILHAIEHGHITTRAIMRVTGISSTSVVAANLQALESAGHIVMERTPAGEQPYSGRDYARGWDAAAKLLGNPNA